MATQTHETSYASRVPSVNYTRLILFIGAGVLVLTLGYFYIESLKQEQSAPVEPTQSYGQQIPMDDDFYPSCADAGPNQKCVN